MFFHRGGNANVARVLGWIDYRSAAGGRPLDIRPVTALLRRTAGAQRDGSRRGAPAAFLVNAIGRESNAKPVEEFA
jgi:hypothetical protein